MDRARPERRALALVLALLVLASSFAVGTSVGASQTTGVVSAAGSSIALTATSSFAFSPSLLANEPTQASVTVTFTDGDVQSHSFTIASRQGWVIPNSYSPSDLVSFFSQYPPLFSVQVNTSGQQLIRNFTAPAAGWYEFVCNQSGHFQRGMYGFIAFGENLPSNLTVSALSTAAGPAVFIISGSIVVLVVIAIVLGFVIGRRRGALHEMPPERLGYPEPPTPGEPLPPPEPPPPPS